MSPAKIFPSLSFWYWENYSSFMIILFAFCCLQSLIIPCGRDRQVADVSAFDIMPLLMLITTFSNILGLILIWNCKHWIFSLHLACVEWGYPLWRIYSNWSLSTQIWMEKWPLWVQDEIQIAWNYQMPFLIFIHKLLQKQHQKFKGFMEELNLHPLPWNFCWQWIKCNRNKYQNLHPKVCTCDREIGVLVRGRIMTSFDICKKE